MNSFNFDELIVRRGTNCAKWDEAPNDNGNTITSGAALAISQHYTNKDINVTIFY